MRCSRIAVIVCSMSVIAACEKKVDGPAAQPAAGAPTGNGRAAKPAEAPLDAGLGTTKVGPSDKAPVAANKICPVMPEHEVRKALNETVSRVWNGKLVGFCCTDCVDAWDAMDEKQRQEAWDIAEKTKR